MVRMVESAVYRSVRTHLIPWPPLLWRLKSMGALMAPRLSGDACDSENSANPENAVCCRSEKSIRYLYPGSGTCNRDALTCYGK
jgi:hypothetical protein